MESNSLSLLNSLATHIHNCVQRSIKFMIDLDDRLALGVEKKDEQNSVFIETCQI